MTEDRKYGLNLSWGDTSFVNLISRHICSASVSESCRLLSIHIVHNLSVNCDRLLISLMNGITVLYEVCDYALVLFICENEW